jgi:glycosyltransferase involved in cell wall biosynthesis
MEEGLPNVAMEASACGCPVFASHLPGMSEVVINGETGLVLPAGDVMAWKNALIAYVDQAPQLRVMGKQARQRMELLFDSRHYTPQMLDLYTAALREPLYLSQPQS